MLFESEWCGDAITAPVLVADDPEDEMFRGLGDRMRSPTDLRLNQSGEAPDRCNLAKSPNRRRWIPRRFRSSASCGRESIVDERSAV